jgi:hypothetical protein
LNDLGLFPTSSLFTGRDRAALAFVKAVALSETGAYHIDEPVLQLARDYFSEFELAELAALGVGAHGAPSYETAGGPGP